jgi:hypothetical protein
MLGRLQTAMVSKVLVAIDTPMLVTNEGRLPEQCNEHVTTLLLKQEPTNLGTPV